MNNSTLTDGEPGKRLIEMARRHADTLLIKPQLMCTGFVTEKATDLTHTVLRMMISAAYGQEIHNGRITSPDYTEAWMVACRCWTGGDGETEMRDIEVYVHRAELNGWELVSRPSKMDDKLDTLGRMYGAVAVQLSEHGAQWPEPNLYSEHVYEIEHRPHMDCKLARDILARLCADNKFVQVDFEILPSIELDMTDDNHRRVRVLWDDYLALRSVT